ncbi:hypothetical protein EX30DRAFT_396385 [Ascodesmis nigricans]|uniref:Uncharacterized protein n=1 Tax=Ascodesmis nigricans TaxID=341454 RepID=A0A4S2MV33_9PEZI|nr:hypothetical protein EX30DRAFT_396385 [Ascodesmis nigricans]
MPSTRSTTKPLQTYGRRAGTRIPSKEKKIQIYREFDEAATPAVEKTKGAPTKAFNTPFIITTTSKEPHSSVTLNSSPPQPRTSLRLAWNLKTQQDPGEYDKVGIEPAPSSLFQSARTVEQVSPFDTDEEYSADEDTDSDESSGIVIDPFQDESNIIADTSGEDDSDGDNDSLNINAPFPSPSTSPPIPSKSLKPMVVIHKRTTTTTTTSTSAPPRNGVLIDKTTRSQVVSIGDYDTVVNPEKDQENQIHQGRSGKGSKSSVTIIGEKEKGKDNKPVGRIAKAMRKAKSVITRPKTTAPTMDTRTGRKMYLPVPKDGYGTETPRHVESLLDQHGGESAEKGGMSDDKLSFEEMLKEGGSVSRSSRKSSRISSKLRIRRSDVSHMLENTDDDELSLPQGKYAVHYEGKEERVIRISVEGDVFDDRKKGVTYPIDLPSEPPIATSTPRHKRQHSNIPDKATKKLKIPKLGKDSTEVRKSTRQKKISPSKVESADVHPNPKDDGTKASKEKSKDTKVQSNGKKFGGVRNVAKEEASASKRKIKSGKTSKKNLIDTGPNDSGLMDMVESSAAE